MRLFPTFGIGLLFGVGLLLSGMTNPAKVLGFLDLAGDWDPSLACVMAGAILAALPAFTWAKHRPQSLLGEPMRLPTTQRIDRRLILGSVLFGVGWGLAGICPGPALVLMALGSAKPLIFGLAMIVGMALFSAITPRPAPIRPT